MQQNAALRVSLPSVGMVQSYNVSVAAAVVLSLLHARGALAGHPLRLTQREKCLFCLVFDGKSSREEKDDMLARWLIYDVPASHVVLDRHKIKPLDL